uniref:Nudix hydrolase domain-containing protein n=1 Tax=Parastrongyloides trichosuri TaxID=131310 RepID=A0A0N4ZD14_PARTI
MARNINLYKTIYFDNDCLPLLSRSNSTSEDSPKNSPPDSYEGSKNINVYNKTYVTFKTIKIKAKEKKTTYKNIFSVDKIGTNATEMIVEDAYLYSKGQMDNLYNITKIIKSNNKKLEKVLLYIKEPDGNSLIAFGIGLSEPDIGKDIERIQKAEKKEIDNELLVLKKRFNDDLQITFEYYFEKHHNNFSRIFLNNGVRITMKKGLSIYKGVDCYDNFKNPFETIDNDIDFATSELIAF